MKIIRNYSVQKCDILHETVGGQARDHHYFHYASYLTEIFELLAHTLQRVLLYSHVNLINALLPDIPRTIFRRIRNSNNIIWNIVCRFL